jgi:hypothetical protein
MSTTSAAGTAGGESTSSWDPSVREELAAYAHEAWSGWMEYLFDNSEIDAGGAVTIPPSFVERWMRQMSTPYDQLPEGEKESDRAEADKMLAIMQVAIDVYCDALYKQSYAEQNVDMCRASSLAKRVLADARGTKP